MVSTKRCSDDLKKSVPEIEIINIYLKKRQYTPILMVQCEFTALTILEPPFFEVTEKLVIGRLTPQQKNVI